MSLEKYAHYRYINSVSNFILVFLPTIIFFSALTSVLFYFGILQVVVKGLAKVMTKLMKITAFKTLRNITETPNKESKCIKMR